MSIPNPGSADAVNPDGPRPKRAPKKSRATKAKVVKSKAQLGTTPSIPVPKTDDLIIAPSSSAPPSLQLAIRNRRKA